MKRCPECDREYDNTMMFCLDDGAGLLYGPASMDEPPTAFIHSTAAPGEAPTRLDIHTTNQPDNSNAVAVLPFANLSRSEDNEYFSDGLAEELLNVLSKIGGIRVAARTSAFAFKGKQASIEEIGRALHVQFVLEGSVRMAGERVRIAVQLVDVENGYYLWSETYDRTMDDIFAMQDDIAHSVVAELRSHLVDGAGAEMDEKVASEVANAVKGRAANPEAHRLMLLGRYLIDRTTQDDTLKATEYFRQALELDPGYALCWAELGQAYRFAAGAGWDELESGIIKAREAAERAIALEPDLAEGYAVLSWIHLMDLDFRKAESMSSKALELAPGNSFVLLRVASVRQSLGLFDNIIDLYQKALILDPLSARCLHNFGRTNYYMGRLAEAESAFSRALELAPQKLLTRASLALVLLAQGRSDEALAQAMLEPGEFWRLRSLAIIYNAAGRRADSDEALDRLVSESAKEYAFQIAEIYSSRGEPDAALDWLGRALAERDPGLYGVKVSPELRSLQGNPRYQQLLRKIGFPDENLSRDAL
jgi:TolB-like protein/Tfp pilus assembly protein PilF